ncbi:hypothetical protein PIB30_098938 [Stylosanthes scabra]|uniref:Uncharacterized protein n=1 Tax=Stylosanthes scabra TaxID=79078 RepID=A0ABU6TWC5_9FABA|nr:hypothetical protein [Stylosanthes scabra]
MLEAVIQERLELQDIQQKMDDQLTVVTRLANQVIQNNPSQGLSFKDTLDAVTLRSGTQLKEPPMLDLVAQAPPKRDTTPKGNSEGPAVAQREVITDSTEPIAKKVAHLPYPTASKK